MPPSIPTSARWKATRSRCEVNQRFPDLLLREAAVLHGGHGALQYRRHRRRRQHADGRAHPPDHQSVLGEQAHRHRRQSRRSACSTRWTRVRRILAIAARPLQDETSCSPSAAPRTPWASRTTSARIVTDTEHAGRHNRVVGGDLSIKFSPPPAVLGHVSGVANRHRIEQRDAAAQPSQVTYGYNTRRFVWASQVEHYGRDFQMDTAFYNRTGFTSGWSFGEVNFYPREGSELLAASASIRSSWRKLGRDQVQDGDEAFLNTGIRFNFTRQGFLQDRPGPGPRAVGRPAVQDRRRNRHATATSQILRWLHVSGGFNTGREILLRPGGSVSGTIRDRPASGVTLQPNQHLSQNIDVQHSAVRSGVDRRARFHRPHREPQDHLPVRQALPRPAARAVRQLEPSPADGPAGVVRVRARHGVPRRLRLAVRETRLRGRTRSLPNRPATI